MRLKHLFYVLPLRLRSLFRRNQVEKELDEEMQYHLERQIEQNIAGGMRPDEARYAALRAIGGIEQRKEECRDMRRLNLIQNLLQDFRYAGRMLRKSPGFTAVAILSLAFGIGANTAIFQLVDALRIRSLPVVSPEQLAEIRIGERSNRRGQFNGRLSSLTNPLWEKIHDQQQAFAGAFVWGDDRFNLTNGGEKRFAEGLWVSGEVFQVLGVRPALGRLFTSADDRRGCASSGAVISYGFWQREFGSDPAALEKALTLEKAWDKMQIPHPLSRAVMVGAPLIFVSLDADAEELKRKHAEMQSALERVRDVAESWFGLSEEERQRLRTELNAGV